MTKKALKKAEENALLTTIDVGADSGAGMEGADKDSYAIPFLRVLQKLSPQCDEANAAFIDGAKAGMLYNSVTGKVYDGKEGVIFLPCAFQRRFLQWGARGTDNDGYHGEHTPAKVAQMREAGTIVALEGRLYLADDKGDASEKRSDRFVDTRSHFGLLVEEDGSASAVLLALSSTQIKKSKQLMSMLHSAKVKTADGMVTPPTWMNRIRITTLAESNDQGSWHGVKFTPEGFIQEQPLYEAGKAFHESVAEGQTRADFSKDTEQQSEDDAF